MRVGLLEAVPCIQAPIGTRRGKHGPETFARLRVKAQVGIDESIATATTIWLGADWFERKAFDMFGIRFEGHPNLKRILNVEEMIIFPLRKEYPLEDQIRDDKNDAMFGR